jgi:dolichyl-phosphate beta-glucosyltransferase
LSRWEPGLATPVTIVIPCYNERSRFSPTQVRRLIAPVGVRVLLVDDGSTDDTDKMLQSLWKQLPDRVALLRLSTNSGKAEAVRQGMLAAMADGCSAVGYLDADFSTPAEEMIRLVRMLEESGAQAVLAARVGLLGTKIKRRMARHYLGRVFATFASLILNLPVYDTQCGAKVFRASLVLRAALADPFHARWAFDVELIGRLLANGLSEKDFIEVPLQVWADAPGSQLTPLRYPLLGYELVRIHLALAQLRQRVSSVRAQFDLAGTERGDGRKDVA